MTLAYFAASQENKIKFSVSYDSVLEVILANISDDETPLKIQKTHNFDENKIISLSYKAYFPVDGK